MIKHILFICIVYVAPLVRPSPVPSRDKEIDGKVLYDQRQEGEWNVRADLKNFVILIIPTHTSASSTPGTPTLLDFLSKSIPKRNQLKKLKQHKRPTVQEASNQETLHFIESKTAPYHVDITKSKQQLAKLHPENLNTEEVIIANSPSVALVNPKTRRISRAVVLTLPSEDEYVVTKTEDHKKVVKKDGKKKVHKEISKPPMKLLGAENEQCGPGLERDSQGICRVIKN